MGFCTLSCIYFLLATSVVPHPRLRVAEPDLARIKKVTQCTPTYSLESGSGPSQALYHLIKIYNIKSDVDIEMLLSPGAYKGVENGHACAGHLCQHNSACRCAAFGNIDLLSVYIRSQNNVQMCPSLPIMNGCHYVKFIPSSSSFLYPTDLRSHP